MQVAKDTVGAQRWARLTLPRPALSLLLFYLLALLMLAGGAPAVTPAEAGEITVTPIADSYAYEASPAKNYAGHPILKLRKSTDGGNYRSYIRFRVTGLTRPVTSAKLRLYVTDGSSSGASVYRSDESWQEATLSWANSPGIAGAPLASVGTVATGSWVELDLTSTITADGSYSFALQNSNADGAFYSSREGGHAPELVITQSEQPGPTIGDVGFPDGSFSGTTTPTNTKRGESPLWFNDGFWWASIWDPVSAGFHIFRLSTATQTWSDTRVSLDTRPWTAADTLWDGTHLYVASHLQSSTPAAGHPSYLYRFSYDPVADRYQLDPGFPARINDYKVETLVIDKDSTGKLWATWMQDNKIYVNRTTTDDRSWGTPFALAGSDVAPDDLSALVAFDGKIGVMWGNQIADRSGFYFAIHEDGQPETSWQPSTPVWAGAWVGDDHINLKADSTGRVYAAVKSSLGAASAPLTALLVRDPATGAWTRHTVDTVAGCPNRPTVVVDEVSRLVHVLQTGPAAPAFACTDAGGDIYRKTSPLGAISFPAGYGTPILRDADSLQMHNVAASKQPVSPASGLVALAVEQPTTSYWHHFDPLGASGPSSSTFTPIADAFVSEASPARNYAGNVALKLRKSNTSGGDYRSYIRFRVAGLSAAVLSAKLRLYVTDPSSSGASIHRSDESWQEPTLTWSNSPGISGSVLASLGKVATGTWVELDLTSTITADGSYSFALQNSNADGAFYSSREGAHPPELVIIQAG